METGEVVRLTLDRSDDGCLGFSVRGGSEHGLGVFISKVQKHMPAAVAGLCVGDQIVEVNGVSMENISMSSAVKVLTGHARLRLLVQRVGRVPGVCRTNEKITWVDLIHRRMVVEEPDLSPYSSDGALCRTVQLTLSHAQACLGLNIRGGREYNLGIYVSKLDPGGLAELSGVKMGDQILSANGVSFESISHGKAVEVLKNQAHVTLTIKEAGRFPAYKEMVTEFSWNSSPGSDSLSSCSSLSSGALSQATLPLTSPLPFSETRCDEDQYEDDHDDGEEGNDGGSEQLCTLSRGQTELLQDSVIRTQPEERKSIAPIRRTRSHVTISETEKKKIQQEEEEIRRTRTFFSLFRRSSSATHGSSNTSWEESLRQVQRAAQRLLEDEDTAVLMEICKKYSRERELQTLTRDLTAVLNTPEKLLLLREIRALVSCRDLPVFNSVMSASEDEAYHILKTRAHRSDGLPLCSAEDSLQAFNQVNVGPINPLLDVPVNAGSPLASSSTSPAIPNWLLAESTDSHQTPGNDQDIIMETKIGQTVWEKGTLVDGDELLTAQDAPPARRTLLSQVFSSLKSHRSAVAPAGEFQLTTVNISKTKQSLGISISGGAESSVQPRLKIEKIFPGGAASANEDLKAGLELLSVDGVCLDGVTHQDAVDIIRQAFSDKTNDPMKLIVKVPRDS